MKIATVFALLLVSASAFTAPQFATRAVGKAPATKAVKKVPIKKVAVKKAAVKKVAVKKAAPKKAAPKKKVTPKKIVRKKASPKKVARKTAAPRKAPPASKGYPSFAAKAQNFKLGGGKISGGGANRDIQPVFIHPILNESPIPAFDYKELAKTRKTPQTQEFVYDDGLTILERKQKTTIPAFLTGSARSKVEKSELRSDIDLDSEYPFGLSGDRFQLLFISIFSLFTLVGCLSGNVALD